MHCTDAAGEVVNLGSTEEISILDLAHRVKDATCSDAPIVHMPYELAHRSGFEDIVRRVPDITKAQRLVDFKVTRTLDDILCDAIMYEREQQLIA